MKEILYVLFPGFSAANAVDHKENFPVRRHFLAFPSTLHVHEHSSPGPSIREKIITFLRFYCLYNSNTT